MVTAGRQEHTLQAEIAQRTDNIVVSVARTIIMHHVAESVPKPKMDLRRPKEGESRKQQRSL